MKIKLFQNILGITLIFFFHIMYAQYGRKKHLTSKEIEQQMIEIGNKRIGQEKKSMYKQGSDKLSYTQIQQQLENHGQEKKQQKATTSTAQLEQNTETETPTTHDQTKTETRTTEKTATHSTEATEEHITKQQQEFSNWFQHNIIPEVLKLEYYNDDRSDSSSTKIFYVDYIPSDPKNNTIWGNKKIEKGDYTKYAAHVEIAHTISHFLTTLTITIDNANSTIKNVLKNPDFRETPTPSIWTSSHPSLLLDKFTGINNFFTQLMKFYDKKLQDSHITITEKTAIEDAKNAVKDAHKKLRDVSQKYFNYKLP